MIGARQRLELDLVSSLVFWQEAVREYTGKRKRQVLSAPFPSHPFLVVVIASVKLGNKMSILAKGAKLRILDANKHVPHQRLAVPEMSL